MTCRVDLSSETSDKKGMSQQRKFSRRDFLKASGGVSLGVGAGLALPNIFLNRTRAATGENPSEFVRVGFIGVGGQGLANLKAMMKNVAAVCDVDKNHLAEAAKLVERT